MIRKNFRFCWILTGTVVVVVLRYMYVPVLNSKEKAQELIDIVREQTDAPIEACINTVSIILSSLLRDLPDVCCSFNGLRLIKNTLEKDDIIDVDNCYDAKLLEQLIASITSHIEDKGQVCIMWILYCHSSYNSCHQ